MSLGKILAITAVILCSILTIAWIFKGGSEPVSPPVQQAKKIQKNEKNLIEVDLDQETMSAKPVQIQPVPVQPPVVQVQEPVSEPKKVAIEPQKPIELPEENRIDQLFSTKGEKLPIVETITYKSRVAWQKGRPAWLSDYASHYETSRHFIARSLNGKPDYLKQDLAEGDKFNVLRQDIPIEFQLVIDASRCKLWFYYIDKSKNEKVLLKTYPVCLGRPDSSKVSGLLTPLGKYSLGKKVATYKPTVMGHYKGQKTEMISVFGTRWIPFDKEISNCTLPSKGFGIHGVPWVKNDKGTWEQDLTSLSHYESDGCVRMASDDIEEIFAIIITKPTSIELIKDFSQSDIHTQ